MLLTVMPTMNSEDHKPILEDLELTLADPEFQQRARIIVRRVVRRFEPSLLPADDVYQSVMLRLLEYSKRANRKRIKNWNGFLYITARNVILDSLDKEGKVSIESLDELPEFVLSDQLGEAQGIETGLLLRDFMKKGLDAKELRTLESIIQGYTDAQMAAMLGLSRQTAAKRISRLKKKLREYLFGIGDTM